MITTQMLLSKILPKEIQEVVPVSTLSKVLSSQKVLASFRISLLFPDMTLVAQTPFSTKFT